MEQLTVPARRGQLDEVQSFVDDRLQELEFDAATRRNIALAVEEVFVNIASYAYPGGEGNAVIRCAADAKAVTLEFEDRGVRFNPLELPDPDITPGAEERTPGGLGIYLVKKLMDWVEYRSEDGKNILSIRKNRTSE